MMAVCCVATGAMAQQPVDTLQVIQNESADFTFTESQLDEDNDAAQTVSAISSTNSDAYLSEVGYLFSPMRFRVRALDNQYSQTYMNGLYLNDVERGQFGYSMIGGMNDATRNRESVIASEYNRFGWAGIGGAQNINTRASRFAQGSKVALSACNRNYLGRGMFTYGTGILPSGWAFAGSVGYRWANEGVIEGTFYNSASFFLAAEKKWDSHSLSLVAFGSPTERAQQGASTEEAYWLANSHYYNPNWGYQAGEKRNARVVRDFEPTGILTWDWDINPDMQLTTNAGFKYAMYSSTALGWSGDAYDPRPDYYKNFPSSVFNVYDPEVNNPENFEKEPWLLEQYNKLYDHWTSSKANRQINWDRMYYVNRENEAAGGEALYYQERRHNDQMMGQLSSVLNVNLDRYQKLNLGFMLNSTKGMHYKTMADLLGGTKFTDVNKFAVNDYGINSDEAQNDLNNPNRQIGVDDKFDYNYNIFVNKARAFGHYEYNKGIATLGAAGFIEGTTMEREGLMRNGRAKNNSFGKSGKAKFLSGGGKVNADLRFGAGHTLHLAAGMQSNAPLARNSFVAPRIQNNFVDNLKNEQAINAELGYSFRFGSLSGVVKGYYARTNNGVEQTAYFNDQRSTFTYLTMSDVEKQYYGVEAAFKYEVNSKLSFSLIGTYGEAEYANNPFAQVNYEGMNAAETEKLNVFKNPVTGQKSDLRVVADGMRVSGTPLAAVSLGAAYNTNGWFFEANVNYYDRVYVGFSQYRRLNSTYAIAGRTYVPTSVDATTGMPTYDFESLDQVKEDGGILFDDKGKVVKAYAAKQEKFDGGFMVDASIGKFIRLSKGRSLSINLQVQNLTNNRNMRTGGYEQNRDDNYYNENAGEVSQGRGKTYKFSKNSKYYYANAINAFLNIGFRF